MPSTPSSGACATKTTAVKFASTTNIYARRTSLPAAFHCASPHLFNNNNNNNNLSPKLGFLKEISEFEMEPPFLSPASSSSSADASPMLLSPTTRPASARFFRRRYDFSPTDASPSPCDVTPRRCSCERGRNVNGDATNNNEDTDGDKDAKVFQRSLHSHRQHSHQAYPHLTKSSQMSSVFFKHSRVSKNKATRTSDARKKFSMLMESPRSLHHYQYGRIAEHNADDDASENADDALYDVDSANAQIPREIRAETRCKKVAEKSVWPEMRNFMVDSSGRILGSDIRSLAENGKIFKSKPTRSHKSRRSTCPEIWLSSAEEERGEVLRCQLRIFGSAAVGRKSIARQLLGCADIVPLDDLISIASEELQRPSRTVSFMMNESEIQLEIELASKLRIVDEELCVYVVVYSIDDRDSFTKAAKILYRLYGHRVKSSIPLILVANKIDLQRRRRVTTMEGKMLSKIYKCSFVETSALLSMNVDTLWAETLKKLHKSKATKDRAQDCGFGVAPMDASTGSWICASDVSARRNSTSRRFVGRILSGTRRFAKSCEELVAKMVAL